ncbi:type II toxin-antitoxin system HicB family antitoxin [Patescibacteria group bacterium]|nr:type II toxin-antitoxin system HicB family antitoxin [Patescibacteria group bacterium]MBU3923179.1 type II toxin-antitoxin system HicB family antitoxin [Patescibacteria group bacterium]
MKKNKFIYITWKEGKYYVAQCLNVDVSSFGDTRSKALKNLEEALELYLEDIPKSEIIKVEQPTITTHQLKYV